jgi:uncharacterized BrkB/YihY/UPF0761 family membrane protein
MTPNVSGIGKISDRKISDSIIAAILFVGGALGYRFMSPVRVRWRHALVGSSLLLVLLYSIKGEFTF